jgi:phage tail P2-like protein
VQTQSLIPLFEDIKLHSADYVARQTFKELSSEIKAIETLANPLECDEKYLPFLAYAFKVDFWDESLSIDNKRALINQSLKLHKIKGTTGAVKKVFKALSMKATVEKWFEYGGEPYHFRIDLSLEDSEITPTRVKELTKYVCIYKNVRSILDELILSYVQTQVVSFASGGVGEVSINSQMLEGYEETLKGMQKLSIGVVGETSSYAVMEV